MNTYLGIILQKIRSFPFNRIKLNTLIINSELNKPVSVNKASRIYGSSIGRYTYVARDCLIQNTEIGRFCSIADGCSIGMPSHPTDMMSTSPVFLEGRNPLRANLASFRYENCPRTVIGNDVWIGTDAKIKSGLSIGDGAIIAAGAVVTKDVEPYAIVGGVPAKTIRYRFPKETIELLLNKKWWELSDGEISAAANEFNSKN